MRLYAFLPCYNEEMNIESLIGSWLACHKGLAAKGYDLTVVGIDDCSRDTTKQKIAGMAAQYENVLLVAHEQNKGLHGGLNTAISYFLENGGRGDLMVLMDGDNTHDPKYNFDMLEKMKNGCDCVIASRYCANSSIVGVAAHRAFLSDMARHYYKLMLSVPGVQDYTCGYRVYSYPAIEKLVKRFGKNPIKERSFACMMEFLYKLYLTGVQFGEAGFQLRYDCKKGESKMKVFKTMTKSIVAALKLKKLRRSDSVHNGQSV